MNFKFFSILFLITANFICISQNTPINITNVDSYMPVIPQSPDVASLLKYQETPVSKNSGIPQINIPIHTIVVGNLKVPVSLNYHASGVRVNEIAPRTGQGWNLIAGGSITRTVKHLNDDHEYGYIHTEITTQEVYNKCMGYEPECLDYMNTRIRENRLDLEPDIFNYNAPGISGKFTFNQINNPTAPGDIISFPMSDNKITPVFSGVRIDSWIITDSNGHQFFFKQGNVLVSTEGSTIETKGDLPTYDQFGPSSPEYTETWDLTKIVTVNGEEIHFTYSKTRDFYDCTFSGQAMAKAVGERGNLKTTYTKTRRDFTELTAISGSFGSISFYEGDFREDYTVGKSLSEIEVRDRKDVLIKRLELKYSYTQGEYPSSFIPGCKDGFGLYNPNNPQAYDQYTKRMFLDEIEVFGTNTGSNSYKYILDYFNDYVLPHRNSYAQDFWGYYNGANNSTLLFDNPGNYFIDRQVNQGYAITGLLRKIQYPEGGHTLFTYESNSATIYSGSYKTYRLVPFIEKDILFLESDIPDEIEEEPGSDEVRYVYKRPLLLNKRTFNLDYLDMQDFFTGERMAHFSSIINFSRTPNGDPIEPGSIPICITTPGPNGEPSLPIEGECSFWLNIRKTTLNPEEVLDENDIDLSDLEYDDDFSMIELLGLDEKKRAIPTGVYVVELHLVNPVSPLFEGDKFDFSTDTFSISLNYKVAREDINFSEDYKFVDIPVGGQRIAKIEDFDIGNIPVKTREYNYVLEDSIRTSGLILRTPHFYAKVNGIVSESALPAVPLVTTSEGNVTYTRVVENVVDHTNHIPEQTIISTYRYPDLLPEDKAPLKPYMSGYRYGQETSVEIPLKRLEHMEYFDVWVNPEDPSIPSGVLPPTSHFPYRYGIGGSWTFTQYPDELSPVWTGDTFYKLQNGHTRIGLQETTTLFNDNPSQTVFEKTYYKYDNPDYLQASSIETILGDEEKMVRKFYYPYDLVGVEPFAQTLLSSNRLSELMVDEIHMVGNSQEILLSKNKKTYRVRNGNLLPHNVLTAKGNNDLEKILTYQDYDVYGNPTHISVSEGTHNAYIWGYGGQYLVAKIENATYAQVTASNLNLDFSKINDPSSDQEIHDEINKIRLGLPKAQITSYTYRSLIGVSTVTDPKGYRMTYEYDDFGRLKYVKDMDGNVLSKNDYHYKNN